MNHLKFLIALFMVLTCQFLSAAQAIKPPQQITSDGVGVYSVNAASTDSSSALRVRELL